MNSNYMINFLKIIINLNLLLTDIITKIYFTYVKINIVSTKSIKYVDIRKKIGIIKLRVLHMQM